MVAQSHIQYARGESYGESLRKGSEKLLSIILGVLRQAFGNDQKLTHKFEDFERRIL
jgi:hypothetical protein